MDSCPYRWAGIHKVKMTTFLVTHTVLHERRMCAKYSFKKPNDRRALDLMNAAAKAVVSDLPDITIAYGVSDEYRYSLLSQQRWIFRVSYVK